MIERPESGQSPIAQSAESHAPQPGHFLKSEEDNTTVNPSEIEDESDGMEKPDFLGKTNLENRDKESEENKA